MLYSVGYEGRTVDGLVDVLRMARVQVLVDVRLTPVSRKPGLSKTALGERLRSKGIEYVHERELGNPADNRDGFRAGDPAAIDRFAARLDNGARSALERVAELAKTSHVALLCVEREPERCHRQVISDAAQGLAPDLMVVPL